jgi:hypothetical protein
MSFSGKWVELKILLAEINQIEKDKYQIFLICGNLDLKK